MRVIFKKKKKNVVVEGEEMRLTGINGIEKDDGEVEKRRRRRRR